MHSAASTVPCLCASALPLCGRGCGHTLLEPCLSGTLDGSQSFCLESGLDLRDGVVLFPLQISHSRLGRGELGLQLSTLLLQCFHALPLSLQGGLHIRLAIKAVG